MFGKTHRLLSFCVMCVCCGVLTTAVPLDFAQCAEEPAKACSISIDKAINEGLKLGRVVNKELSGAGTCNFEANVFTLTASPKGSGAKCIISYFPKLTLPSGWVFREFALVSQTTHPDGRTGPLLGIRYLKRPEVGSKSLEVSVELTAERGQTLQYMIQSFTLQGSDCNNWKDAFALSVRE